MFLYCDWSSLCTLRNIKGDFTETESSLCNTLNIKTNHICELHGLVGIRISGTLSTIPLAVEQLFPALLYLAPKWQSLGEALSLDEDRLDEIFTNNETDEACLREMLVVYMMRSDLKHSWEEIHEAVNKADEKIEESDSLANVPGAEIVTK